MKDNFWPGFWFGVMLSTISAVITHIALIR